MFYFPMGREEAFEPKVVKWLIIANGVMFIITLIYTPLFYLLALVPSYVLNGQRLWTLVTHMFLHAGFLHIFLNMYALFIFGPECEKEFGHLGFLILYFTSGLVGALLHILLTPAKNTPAVGASGAIFGVMAAFAILYPRRRLGVFFFVGFIVLPAWALVVIFAIIETLYFIVGIPDFVAHMAHVGGMLGGALFTFIYKRTRRRRRPVSEPIMIVYQAEEYYEDEYGY